MHIMDNLYGYFWSGRGNNCHSYLFKDVLLGERPHVLIDPGHVANEFGERCLERLIGQLSQDGVAPESIGLILNTHSHADHCEANPDLARMGDAQGQAMIALSKPEDEFRKTTGVRLHQMMGRSMADFDPSFYLEEGDLNLGKGENMLTLQVLSTPGHSPGSVSFYWPLRKVLITGDTVFNGSIGRTDLPGGSGEVLKQSINRLAELEVECLLPGHDTEYGNIIRGRDMVERNFAFIRANYFPML